MSTRYAGRLLLLSALLVSEDAWARPGGGQSFGGSSRSSGGSSRSSGSSGSSSGSGSSGRSSGGSSWSFGGSSKSSGGSSSPSYTPSYQSSPSQAAIDEQQRMLDEQLDSINCMQRCSFQTDSGDSSTCQGACVQQKKKERLDAANAKLQREQAALERERERERAMPPDQGMGRVFLAPVAIGGGVLALLGALAWYRRRADSEWASALNDGDDFTPWQPPAPAPRPAGTSYASVAAAIAALKASDEAFSWVLFEDFVHALYVEAHMARGNGELSRLAPYLAGDARMVLQTLPVAKVTTIVVGGMQTHSVVVDKGTRRIVVTIAFTTNYTEQDGATTQSYYVEELWTLSRDADVKSRPPERARVIDCPTCGAPLEKLVAGRCRYCSTVSEAGSHDWRVDRIRIESREPRGPMLTGTTEETGTDLPTVVAPDLKQHFAALVARDPEVTWLSFTKRIETIFARFHSAWSAQELAPVRPYLSDNLFETQQYWVSAYKAAGLRNVTGSPTIATIHLSSVTSDKYFDAVTVRVYASCFDYTLNAQGQLVGGSQRSVREYSEYWTLIRAADHNGAAKIDDTCPNCGAPAAGINMAGFCEACSVKVTNGDFDWVLSRIEQDEVFQL